MKNKYKNTEEEFERYLEVVRENLKKHSGNADDILNRLKKILTTRGNKYKEFETKRDYNREKGLISELLKDIFEIYKNQGNKDKIQEVIILINKHFDLIRDDGNFSIYTPRIIFEIFRDYIGIDFENNFEEIVKLIVDKYHEIYGTHKGKLSYKGWELAGGGISQSGDYFSITDRHFVAYALSPAIEEYYQKAKEKEEAWNILKSLCITEKRGNVSAKKPDFLNRAAIFILLKRYRLEDEKRSKEAFNILKEFILYKKGIPSKPDLIYQELMSDFPTDKKWKLIEVSIKEYKKPINVFVEKVITELAKKDHKEAKAILKNWSKSPEYYKHVARYDRNMVQNISQLLENKESFDDGVELLENLIDNIDKYGSFETYKTAPLLHKVLKTDFKKWLEIISDLIKEKKLSNNQQILLCYSPFNHHGSSNSDSPELLEKVYKEFIDPFLKELDDNIDKIQERLTFSNAREAFVQFADRLVVHKKTEYSKDFDNFKKTLRIIKIFIKDQDPYLPGGNDPDDKEDKYNQHKKIIENGEEQRLIDSVRGWCAWALTKCAVLGARSHIDEVIKLTKRLVEDENYYIKHMSCYPLAMLAKQRLTHLPDKSCTLFLNNNKEEALKSAKDIEKITFNLLKEVAKKSDNVKKVLAKSILHVFDDMRALNENDAWELVKTFKEFPSEAVAEAVVLFIFFAEFRKDGYKDWRWKMPGLYDDLGPEKFNDKKFKDVIDELIEKKNEVINSRFAWHFWSLIKTSAPDELDDEKALKYSDAFKIAYRYSQKLVEEYAHQVFRSIYMLIKDNVNKKSKECYDLWKKCLEKERPVMEKVAKEKNILQAQWWPCRYNGDILMTIKEKVGNQEFLNSFKFLLDYPKEIDIGNIDGKIVELLLKIPEKYKEQIEEIFGKLIVRNSKFYDTLERWKKKLKE